HSRNASPASLLPVNGGLRLTLVRATIIANRRPTGNLMPRTSIRFFICAILSSVLCGPQQASAQPFAAPARAIAAAPARPMAAPAPRGATCHDGMSFERFLADLKQQEVAGGVSQN